MTNTDKIARRSKTITAADREAREMEIMLAQYDDDLVVHDLNEIFER